MHTQIRNIISRLLSRLSARQIKIALGLVFSCSLVFSFNEQILNLELRMPSDERLLRTLKEIRHEKMIKSLILHSFMRFFLFF